MPQASAMRPVLASVSAAFGARQLLAKRTFATSTSQKQCLVSRAQAVRSQISGQQLRSSFKRSYADAVRPQAPVKAKKSGFRKLRWLWRATYLSAIGGLAWVAYGIIETKNPADQPAPDPSKKTLVVLGSSFSSMPMPMPLLIPMPIEHGTRTKKQESRIKNQAAYMIPRRHWLGIRLSSQEPRHRKLQRHCHLASQLLPLHASSTVMHNWSNRTSLYHGTHPQFPPSQEVRRQVLRG